MDDPSVTDSWRFRGEGLAVATWRLRHRGPSGSFWTKGKLDLWVCWGQDCWLRLVGCLISIPVGLLYLLYFYDNTCWIVVGDSPVLHWKKQARSTDQDRGFRTKNGRSPTSCGTEASGRPPAMQTSCAWGDEQPGGPTWSWVARFGQPAVVSG